LLVARQLGPQANAKHDEHARDHDEVRNGDEKSANRYVVGHGIFLLTDGIRNARTGAAVNGSTATHAQYHHASILLPLRPGP